MLLPRVSARGTAVAGLVWPLFRLVLLALGVLGLLPHIDTSRHSSTLVHINVEHGQDSGVAAARGSGDRMSVSLWRIVEEGVM